MSLITNFKDLLLKTKKNSPLKLSLAFPHNDHVLISLYLSAKEGIIEPYISGNREIIESLAKKHNIDLSLFKTFYLEDNKCLPNAINLVANGTCHALMKGDSTTAEVMSLVLKKENNLRTSSIISHVFALELPKYHKLLFITDAAINIAPSVSERIEITKNAIKLANACGINTPKVAVLSALETVNYKMPSTLEAKQIADNLELKKQAVIEGPLSFDCAIHKEAAEIKHLVSEVSGDVDILVIPNIEVGNTLAKSLIHLGEANAAGLVLGPKVPIILTSRSDSITSKVLSTALASVYLNQIKDVH